MEGRTSIADLAARGQKRQHSHLSEVEHVILELLADGLSNGEIGKSVIASRATIDRTMRAVVRKLGARNRIEAVATAIRAGLI